MMDAKDLLLALRKRDDLVSYLDSQQLAFRRFREDHPDYPGGINFEIGDERWLAVYYSNGNFKMLIWG